MCPVLAHSAISRRPKKQFLDFPGGKRLVSFNKTTAHQPSWCDFSLGKQSLRNTLDLLFASCFYLFLAYLLSISNKQQPPSPLLASWAALLCQSVAEAGTSAPLARWVLGSVGPCPEQSQRQRCCRGFSALHTCKRSQQAKPNLHWWKLLAHISKLSMLATERWLSLSTTKLESPSL